MSASTRRSHGDRRSIAAVVVALLLLASGACSVSFSSSDDPTTAAPTAAARSVSGGIETWDLTKKPSRSDVGIESGDDTSAFVTRKARPVRVLLPEGIVVSTSARIVTFEAMSSGNGTPSSMDVSTALLSPADGYDMFKRQLTELGLPTTKADEWKALAEASPKGDVNADLVNVSTSRRTGYIGFGINLKYFPQEQNAKIQWTLYWGPDPLAASSSTPSP